MAIGSASNALDGAGDLITDLAGLAKDAFVAREDRVRTEAELKAERSRARREEKRIRRLRRAEQRAATASTLDRLRDTIPLTRADAFGGLANLNLSQVLLLGGAAIVAVVLLRR